MITFLPAPSFEETAKLLDRNRLNAMRRESKAILTYIQKVKENDYRFINQPVVKMWFGHENALHYYRFCMMQEWANRGYQNNQDISVYTLPIVYPEWFGDKDFHKSHKLVLCRKSLEHEQRQKPLGDYDYRNHWLYSLEDYVDCNYIWPVTNAWKALYNKVMI